jgi:hypothetical protein
MDSDPRARQRGDEMTILLVIVGVLVFVVGTGYLVACSGAGRWINFRKWWNLK